MAMTKPTGKPVGRPPKHDKPISKTLGGVRVTEDQLANYDKAAKLKGVTRSEWLTELADKAAARALKNQGG